MPSEANAEIIGDGQTGAVVPPEEPAALAAALSELLADPERLCTMGRAARQRFEAHFMVHKTCAVYQMARDAGFT